MRAIDLSNVTWRKSSYSNPDGGNCVEVAPNLPLVPVRDSKNPAHGTLLFGVDAWAEFVGSVKGQ
ncbi:MULTISPECIES: DUF397 domain-containing protein [unclassified Streptomyces]|uniref:DUF397 domain-containing protein n=1 Tax=unclassified Streptomyces TaxID=2593676 RepID=UPI002E30FC5E|nr:DUF397 domain-containing protein [Streptomyces sp. NBC_00696]